MSVYHFTLKDGRALASDSVELADLHAAKLEAARYLGHLLIDDPENLWSADEWRVEVCDDRALTLFSIFVLPTESAAAMQK